MSFEEKFNLISQKNNSLVCVGLDPIIENLPMHILKEEFPFFVFNKTIIDKTHDLVCAYKPNSAFYEALGDIGIKQLNMTNNYIKQVYPEIPIILDAKRADIGNTNKGYAKFAFEYLNADAITLQPYLGKEALEPFFEYKNKALFILCRTSNPGAGELQDLIINNEPLYKILAKKIAGEWNDKANCMIVAGATFPEELREIRKIVGQMIILSPGIGIQEGVLEKTVKWGINSSKQGLIINSSRGIIFASQEENFAEKAREKTEELKNEINKYKE